MITIQRPCLPPSPAEIIAACMRLRGIFRTICNIASKTARDAAAGGNSTMGSVKMWVGFIREYAYFIALNWLQSFCFSSSFVCWFVRFFLHVFRVIEDHAKWTDLDLLLTIESDAWAEWYIHWLVLYDDISLRKWLNNCAVALSNSSTPHSSVDRNSESTMQTSCKYHSISFGIGKYCSFRTPKKQFHSRRNILPTADVVQFSIFLTMKISIISQLNTNLFQSNI